MIISKHELIWNTNNFHNIFKTMMVPTPLSLKKDIVRVFYTAVDKKNKGLPFFFDYNLKKKKILNFSKKSILVSKLKSFYSNGMILCSVFKKKKKLFSTFAGFCSSKRGRYSINSGIMESNNNGKTFKIIQEEPLIKLKKNQLIQGGPFFTKIRNKHFLFTVDGYQFDSKTDKPKYLINQLEFCFDSNYPQKKKNKDKTIVLKLKKNETAHGRPYIIQYKKKYHLFFSVRNKKGNYTNYFGHSISNNGNEWKRISNIYIKGQDSVCYLANFIYQNKIISFFGLNNFGETGILKADLPI